MPLAGAAIGTSLGAMFGAAADISIDDPRLDDFAAALANDTSALILVGEDANLGDFVSIFGPFDGKLIEIFAVHQDAEPVDLVANTFKNSLDPI